MAIGGRIKRGKYSALVTEMQVEFDDPQTQIPFLLPLVLHTIDAGRSGILPARLRSGLWVRVGDAGVGAADIDMGIDLTPAPGQAVQVLDVRAQVIDGLGGVTWFDQLPRTTGDLHVYQSSAGDVPVDNELIAGDASGGMAAAVPGEQIQPQDGVAGLVVIPGPAITPVRGAWFDIQLATIATGTAANINLTDHNELPLLFRTQLEPNINQDEPHALGVRWHRGGTAANQVDLLIVRVNYSVADIPRLPIHP